MEDNIHTAVQGGDIKNVTRRTDLQDQVRSVRIRTFLLDFTHAVQILDMIMALKPSSFLTFKQGFPFLHEMRLKSGIIYYFLWQIVDARKRHKQVKNGKLNHFQCIVNPPFRSM